MNNKKVKDSGATLRQSLVYSAVGNLGSQGISLLGFFVLARLLSPREFGLMTMVTVFTGIAGLFLNMGMDAAIIQNRQANERHYSTAFWLNGFLGTFFFVFAILGAGVIAGFYNAREIVPIIRTVAVLFVLNAVVIVPIALLKKRQLFKQIAKIEIFSMLCGLLAGILFAYTGWGVWALVVELLVNAVVVAILAFRETRWHPVLIFGRDEFVELWKYSGYLVGTNVITYAYRNVDYLLIGRMIGAKILGAYKYAYQIATYPQQIVYGVMNRVLFSFYSSSDSKETIGRLHLRVMRVVAFAVFPFYFGMSAITDHFVLTVLGEKWKDTIPLLGFLVIIFLFDTVSILDGPLYLSQGATKLLLKLSVFLRIDLIVFMIIGIFYGGIQGLLVGLLLAKIVNYFPFTYFSSRLVGLTIKDIIFNIAPMFISSVLMFTLVIIGKAAIFTHPGRVLDFASLVVLGILAYFFISLVLQRSVINEFWQMLNLPGGHGIEEMLSIGLMKLKRVFRYKQVKVKKIFCIGSNKTGTTSLAAFFRANCFKVGNQEKAELLIADWANRDFTKIIKYCNTADVFQDIPFSLDFTYTAVDQAFPGSKFILTVRTTPEEWYESLLSHHSKRFSTTAGAPPSEDDLRQFRYRNKYQGWLLSVQEAVYAYPSVPLYDKQAYMANYETHNARVIDYFKSRPDDLLILNLSEDNAFQKLCQFLGLNPDKTKLIPHLNRSKDMK